MSAEVGRRGRPVVTLVTVTAVVIAAVALSRLGGPAGTSAPAAPRTSVPVFSVHAVATETALRGQSAALAGDDRDRYLASWSAAAAARRLAARTFDNLRLLGVDRLVLRPSLPSLRETSTGWSAAVDVTWAPGSGQADATSTLLYTFVEVSGHPVISSVAPATASRTPVWLLPGLQVRRGPRTMVAATSEADAVRVSRLLRAAVTAVDAVLPRWHGELVAYAPATAHEFDALIDASPGQYRGIAAVTTTVDGSHDPAAATAIVVNPAVFDGLGPLGAHVVIAHEATHVATGAAAVSMPLWVAEGFADYVGIGSVQLPVSVAAKAALSAVRRQGAPTSLPDDADFAVGGAGLEATYELAWVAASLIASTYGQPRLVAFYRAVEAHPDDLEGDFQRVLHVGVAAFTVAWAHRLEELANAG